ncbi:nitroreductase [Candidatus Izimaplasma bacterium ZiA1]|uniref:nitroreductase family protein n=1 Tax=Candidatus Izimoplasma sp. ZiA1 TaxID=2024899 RepID=UPI000BAA9043|nr:nitroreductase [Candidatus Izimaplasma bacterium ZiA1]
MDAKTLLKERRSIRKFKKDKVNRELMNDIIELSKYAPSWANYQIARYTIIDNPEIIKQIASEGVKGFVYNISTLQEASGVAVISYVKGKSGSLDKYGLANSSKNPWEVFDAGIATHQFCLSAYAYGVGSVVMGVIDDIEIARIINLPEDETVAALVVYGYEESHPKPTPRKEVKEITRFL